MAKAFVPSSDTTSSLKMIQEGMTQANDIMQSMANHQVMAMAPLEIRDQFFSGVFDLINAQARNKCHRLQMENEELALRMMKLRREKEDAKQGDLSGDDNFETDDGDLKMPALTSIDCTPNAFINDSNTAAIGEHERKEGTQNVEGCGVCNYPVCVCVFGSGGPPLDTCQGTCGKKNGFHHACNVNWLESNRKDVELCELCYICVQKI